MRYANGPVHRARLAWHGIAYAPRSLSPKARSERHVFFTNELLWVPKGGPGRNRRNSVQQSGGTLSRQLDLDRRFWAFWRQTDRSRSLEYSLELNKKMTLSERFFCRNRGFSTVLSTFRMWTCRSSSSPTSPPGRLPEIVLKVP